MNPQARLGAFVLVALLLLAFATGRVGDMVFFKQEQHIVETEFDDLLGLDVQAPVRMAGVKVGVVQDIYLKNNRARVRIALNPDVRLPASTRATIIGRGLVGEKNLALTARPGDTEWLPDGALIPSDPGGDINTFIARSSDITDDLRKLIHALSGTFGTDQGTSSLRQLLDDTDRAARELESLIRDNRTPLNQASRNLADASSRAATLLQRHRPELDRLLRSLPQTTEHARQFFDEGRQALHDLSEILLENRENLYRILFELRKTSENLEAFSDDIRRNPWKIFKERPEVRPSPRATRLKMEEMLLTTGQMGHIPADE